MQLRGIIHYSLCRITCDIKTVHEHKAVTGTDIYIYIYILYMYIFIYTTINRKINEHVAHGVI